MTQFGYEQPAVQKRLLTARLGRDCGTPRLPTLPLRAEIEAAMLKQAAALGLGPVDVPGFGGAAL